MNDKKAIVLLSGGLDSAVVSIYMAHYTEYEVKAGVFINRGQSNYENEHWAVGQVSTYLKIPLIHAGFEVKDLRLFWGEAKIKKMGVPARNLILGALALPFVYALGCDTLVLGNIAEDVYPDCNVEFRKSFSNTASQALEKTVSVIAPLADWEHWDKADEISFAARSGHSDLFRLTWTCWKAGRIQCGICDACRSRREGFTKAGVKDYFLYEND